MVMDLKSARNTNLKGLEEESETLLKGSDPLDSCIQVQRLTDSFVKMFRSRSDHTKSTAGRNKDVSIPLVRDRDMEEAAALKRKTSSTKDSTVDGSQAEEVHFTTNVCSFIL